MNVVKFKKLNNPTDIALMVDSATKTERQEYDESMIVDALIRESHCDKAQATEIAGIVTERLMSANLSDVSTSLIRSMVNNVLLEKGLNKELKNSSEVSIPFYNITEIIENADKSNGNTAHNPESINLTLAERILKEYALKNVFDRDISESHLSGEIHIHDLGMVNRFYCSGHSPEYVKKHGLKNIPTIPSNSKPANSANVLARHICSFTQFLQGQFAGAIGWEAINVFFAPLLGGMQYKEIKQLAQTLIFDLSQLAGARGGQVAFSDFNVFVTIPKHYENVFAMGAKGKYMVIDELDNIYRFDTQEETKEFAEKNDFRILRYKDFEKEAHLFAKAILEVVGEGDADGIPFAFPKINLHINEECFTNKRAKALLMVAAEASSKSGCPYFIFDRNAFSVSQCCRLKIDFTEEDKKLIDTPEELRFVGGQNVSINMPNIPLKVGTDMTAFYNELANRMEIATRAHIQRQSYVWKLAGLENSPLTFYAKGMDGKAYIRLKNISYLIGIVGLNECVYNLIKEQLHESDRAYLLGLEIVSFMYQKTKELAKKYNINIKLEETPAESTAGRFAKLDIKKYGDLAYHKENSYGVYYTNSIHFAADSDVDYVTRLQKQSKFHTLVEAGSMIHIWAGNNVPSPKAIFNLLETTWYKTKCVQWVLSPEYTICHDCNTRSNGLLEQCPKCGSINIRGITRITGYYVFVDKFNSSKRAELADRLRENIDPEQVAREKELDQIDIEQIVN
jgi:ribonucleoside-triphosphate reductase